MGKLFGTPLDILYSTSTLVVVVMLLFPPYYAIYEYGSSYVGHRFFFNSYGTLLVDFGRLCLQFIGLGVVVVTVKRIMQ